MGRGAEGWAGWDWCLWLPLLEGLWLSGEGFGGFFPLFCWVGLSKLFKGWEGALYFFVFSHRVLKPCRTPVRKGNLIFIEGSLCARYSVGCFTSWLMSSWVCFRLQRCLQSLSSATGSIPHPYYFKSLWCWGQKIPSHTLPGLPSSFPPFSWQKLLLWWQGKEGG